MSADPWGDRRPPASSHSPLAGMHQPKLQCTCPPRREGRCAPGVHPYGGARSPERGHFSRTCPGGSRCPSHAWTSRCLCRTQPRHASCPPAWAPLRAGRRESHSSEPKDTWARAKPGAALEGEGPAHGKTTSEPNASCGFNSSETNAMVRAPGLWGRGTGLGSRDCIREQRLPAHAGPARRAAGQGVQSTAVGKGLEPRFIREIMGVLLGHFLQRACPPHRFWGLEQRPYPTATPEGHCSGWVVWTLPPCLPSSRYSFGRPHHLACPAHRAALGPAGKPHTDPQAPGTGDGNPGCLGSACPQISAFREWHADGDPRKISCLPTGCP